MRRRELQSFTLKLTDLKEYETIRQERESKAQQSKPSTSSSSPMKVVLPKWGSKSKQEIRDRIGIKN